MSSVLLIEEKENYEHSIANNFGPVWMVAVHLLYSLHEYFRFEVEIACDGRFNSLWVVFLFVDLVDVGVNGYFNCIFVRRIGLSLGDIVIDRTKTGSIHSVGG